MEIGPKIHSSGSEFSYRKFEKEETLCPTCTTLEEHRRVRRLRASETEEQVTREVGVQEAVVKVSTLLPERKCGLQRSGIFLRYIY